MLFQGYYDKKYFMKGTKASQKGDEYLGFIIQIGKQQLSQVPIIMASQQPFYKHDSDSFEELQVFSRFSEEQQKGYKKPKIRKISQKKPQRGKVEHKHTSISKAPKQNHQLNSNQCIRPSNEYYVTSPKNNTKPLHDLYNQQIAILRQEIQRLRDVIVVMQNNYHHQIQFHIREQYSILRTLGQLMKAKQYQRIQGYIGTQLLYMEKQFRDMIVDLQATTKPFGSKDTTLESVIGEDPCFKKLVSNLSQNIKQTGIQKLDLLPQIKKLSLEKDLTIKKLSWYLSQVPFQIECKNERLTLAKQIITDLKCQSGERIVGLIEKNIDKQSIKRSRLATGCKSEMSELIAGHTL